MAEFPSSLWVRLAVAFEVAPAGFDAIVEALTLDIAELLRRRIPSATIVIRVILTVPLLRTVLGRAVLGHEQGGCSQGKSKRWKSKSNEFHWWIPPCSSCTAR
jgi:hypothetical protein